ncbi:uncharacterized protein LOC131209118 [Anopheles bellator]|uniref:uncharacterized protein LOC131209118 n=1 Tax=Anopheles bellator TaxID=139047 RepID=UPI0026479F8C|nr:uncharacterized protein LOC131209118 [Anopheles bellator]
MPQELRVVRCVQCLKYQVDIVKKVNKWSCKVCGVKQSLAREFYRGAGKDCRSIVQKLEAQNIITEQREQETLRLVLSGAIQLPEPSVSLAVAEESELCVVGPTDELKGKPSKWDTFAGKTENENSDDMLYGDPDINCPDDAFIRERRNVVSRIATAPKNDNWTICQSTGRQAPTLKRDVFEALPLKATVAQRFDQNAGNEKILESRNGSTNHSLSVQADSFQQHQPLLHFHRKQTLKQGLSKPSVSPLSSQECRKMNQIGEGSASRDAKSFCRAIKRKHSNECTSPLMNFAKRPIYSEANATSSNRIDFCPIVAREDSLQQTLTNQETEALSKWPTFVRPDDETDGSEDEMLVF